MINKVKPIGMSGCIILLCASICSSASNVAHSPANGIFALADAKRGIPAGVYANPNVDGVALRYFWSDLEPRANAFNWSKVDADLNMARRYNKKVSLAVAAGAHTPSWVYAAGAASFPIVWNRPFGGFPECSQQRIPIPWSSAYLSQWTNFIRQFGRRYGSDPAVVVVSLTGINTYSVETNLPHTGRPQGGQSKCSNLPDYESQWKTDGYSSDKVLSAWMSIVDAYASSFPTQRLVAAITPDGFPVISDSSSYSEGSSEYGGGLGGGRFPGRPGREKKRQALEFTLEMYGAAVKRYGSRVVVMNNALNAHHAWQPKANLAQASKAYEMLYRVSNDPKCMVNRFAAPCDPRTTLRSALNNGINAGATYIQVYTVDALNPDLQDVLSDAHSRLKARAEQ